MFTPPLYPNNQRVLVHSFGDPQNYSHFGTVKGIALDHITKIYIVQLDPDSPWEWPYECITVPEGCLLKIPFEHLEGENVDSKDCPVCKIIRKTKWKIPADGIV